MEITVKIEPYHEAEGSYLITQDHSWADIARWIVENGGREDVLTYLEEFKYGVFENATTSLAHEDESLS